MPEHLLPCWSCDQRATVVVLTTGSDDGQPTYFACCPDHPVRTTTQDRIVGVTAVVQGG